MYVEDQAQSAAIICSHAAHQQRVILMATRDDPAFPEDTGWQFTCGQPTPHREEEGLVWALSEVLKLDPTIGPILSAPCQSSFERTTQDMRWQPVAYTEG